jgi:hypothetical protein
MKKAFLLSFIVILFSACAPQVDVPLVTPTIYPTITRTPTISPTPTLKLLPTLTVDIQKQFYEFLSNNGGCELPCLWGITPGTTPLNDAFNLINHYTKEPTFAPYQPRGEQPRYAYSNMIDVSFYVYLHNSLHIDEAKEGKVRGISISTYSSENGYRLSLKSKYFEKYSLLHVLKYLGLPDAIYIDPPIAPRIKDAYSIYAIYKQEKIFLDYYGSADEISDGIYEICPNIGDKDIFDLHVVTADPDDPQIDLISYAIYSFRLGDPYPIEKLGVELDKNKIYDRYIKQASYCFQYDGYLNQAIYP